jgi:hypothetical protein
MCEQKLEKIKEINVKKADKNLQGSEGSKHVSILMKSIFDVKHYFCVS